MSTKKELLKLLMEYYINNAIVVKNDMLQI